MQAHEFLPKLEEYNLQKRFVGVFSIDKLPKKLKFRHFLIGNTDISSGPGIHWFACVRSKKDSIELFDSLGVNAEKKSFYLNHFLFQNINDLECNQTIFQSNSSSSCGSFVLYFLIHRMFNLDLSLDEVLNDCFFANDPAKNEILVQDFFLDKEFDLPGF